MREDSLIGTQMQSSCAPSESQGHEEISINLAHRMRLTGANQLWVADIFIRLKVRVLGCSARFSRKVVGWNLDRTLTARLPLMALENALKERKPAPGLVHHQIAARNTRMPNISGR
jgi:putative transposase